MLSFCFVSDNSIFVFDIFLFSSSILLFVVFFAVVSCCITWFDFLFFVNTIFFGSTFLKNSGFEVFEAYFKISFSSFNSTISTLLFFDYMKSFHYHQYDQLLIFFYHYFCTHLLFFQKLVQIFYLNCLSLAQIVLHLKKQ